MEIYMQNLCSLYKISGCFAYIMTLRRVSCELFLSLLPAVNAVIFRAKYRTSFCHLAIILARHARDLNSQRYKMTKLLGDSMSLLLRE